MKKPRTIKEKVDIKGPMAQTGTRQRFKTPAEQIAEKNQEQAKKSAAYNPPTITPGTPEKPGIPNFNFKTDGSVEYTSPTGEKINLTKEEYQQSVEGTPKTPDASQVVAEREQLNLSAKQEADTAAKVGLTLDEYRRKKAEIMNTELTSPEELEGGSEAQGISKQIEQKAQELRENPSLRVRGNELLGVPIEKQAVSRVVAAAEITEFKSNVAQLVDFARVGFSGKTPLKVQNAKSAFSNSKAEIDTYIEDVRAGRKKPREAKDAIAEAEKAIQSLDSTTKGFAAENLNWWIDNGQEIQSTISRERKELADQKALLLEAERTALLNQLNTPKII